MNKKMNVLALAVVSAALFALPAVASAQSWHLDATSSFSVTGSGGTLTSTAGGSITCTSTTGSGAFSTTTEGTVKLIFHSCKGPLNVSCTSGSDTTGTITALASFHAIMLGTNIPGVLLTPDTSNEPTPGLKDFAEFVCFGLSVKVFGKGSIGTITAPACGVSSTTATQTFTSSATGHQQEMAYTGNTYDLQSTITSSHPTASLDGTGTLHFPAARKMECTS